VSLSERWKGVSSCEDGANELWLLILQERYTEAAFGSASGQGDCGA
jgi:hypothetical protein